MSFCDLCEVAPTREDLIRIVVSQQWAVAISFWRIPYENSYKNSCGEQTPKEQDGCQRIAESVFKDKNGYMNQELQTLLFLKTPEQVVDQWYEDRR